MIVSVVGYGCTGASAYVDLIREFNIYEDLGSSSEFQILKMTDGLIDLYNHVVIDKRALSQNSAINRFLNLYKNPGNHTLNKKTNGKFKNLLKDFVDSISLISWKGKSSFDPNDIRPRNDVSCLSRFNNLLNFGLQKISRNFHYPRYKTRYFTSLTSDEFCKKSNIFIKKLLKELGFKSNNVLLEQFVDACDPDNGMQFVDKCKVIVVDRDPRDVYLLMNYIYKNVPLFMPTNNSLEEFISFYKMQREKKSKSPNVLYVNFEDLIYNYEKTIEKVKTFIGIESDHILKGKIFKPSLSINNTNLKARYPQYKEQISIIENELKDFLYDFDSYSDKKPTGKPFNYNDKI